MKANGYLDVWTRAVSGDEALVITLARPASVTGTVVMPDGSPAAGAEVRLGGSVGPVVSFSSTKRETDALGRFEFAEERPGDHVVDATAGDGFAASDSIRLAEGGTAEVRLVLAPPDEADEADPVPPAESVFVTFDVRTPDGTPVEEFEADVCGADSDPDGGIWRLDPRASYRLVVLAQGYAPFTRERWTPPAGGGAFVVFLRPTAAVRFRVVDAYGAPVRSVYADLDDGPDGSVDSAPDGSFLVDSLEEGKRVLAVGLPGAFPLAAAEFVATAGEVTDVGTLTLVPRVALTGRVLDPEARPLGGAEVEVDAGLPGCDNRAYTHADGTFRILVPGFAKGRLVVSKHGFATTRAEFAQGPARTIGDVLLPVPGAVEVEAEGIDLDEASVVLLGSGAGPEPLELPLAAMDGLVPGRYVVRLRTGETTLEQAVDVVSGETATVTFRVDR